MNRPDPLKHFWDIFFLAIGCFFKLVFLQAVIVGVLFGTIIANGQEGIALALMAFVVATVGGMFFGVVPMALGFVPLYALLSAKGYANWLTAILCGLVVSGVLCLYPSLRQLAFFWVIDGVLLGLFTHWAYQRWIKRPEPGEPANPDTHTSSP